MDSSERIVQLLEELVAWNRFSARDQLEKVLRATLREDRHRSAYELSDGSRSQKQVADAVGLSQPAMSELWKKWRRLGILRQTAAGVSHVMSLRDLGWELQLPAESSVRSRPSQGGSDSGKEVADEQR